MILQNGKPTQIQLIRVGAMKPGQCKLLQKSYHRNKINSLVYWKNRQKTGPAGFQSVQKSIWVHCYESGNTHLQEKKTRVILKGFFK